MRILIFGNSGSGKTTMAKALAEEHSLPHLDLDSLAWATPGVRRSLDESTSAILRFVNANAEWVIEGCYGDLLEVVLPFAHELRFLNPGVEVCVSNCRARPWEPEKYPSKESQDEKLAYLLEWVREYENRTDEYSLERHRKLFNSFQRAKYELP